jgi:hypothetical protein
MQNIEQHIKVVSILFAILGVLGLLVAVGVFVMGAGAAATILSQDGSEEARVGAAWAGGCLTFVAALVGILSVPSVIAGWGLAKRKSWARALTIVLAVLTLPSFPIGTAIGVYALMVMFDEQAKKLLA